MKKIFIILLVVSFPCIAFAVERSKGRTWNEKLIFKEQLLSQNTSTPDASNILLDYTVRSGAVYTATQNRSQASARGTELSTVEDAYVGWIWYFCGQQREVTAYSPSVDGDGVVIGQFTLASNFTSEPDTGSNPRLINSTDTEEVDQIIARLTPEGMVQIGGDNDVGVIADGDDGFVKYKITDDTSQFYYLGTKPVKDDSVSVSTFCYAFATALAGSDPFLTRIGIFLDSVPANTKARVYMLSTDELNERYPIIENVTLDQFSRGFGDAMIESTYADVNTWNFMNISDPTIIRQEEEFNLVFAFSDENGDPVTLDVPVETSLTDVWFDVRSDNIQAASGTSITLDTDASARDDDYNGMRLYIDGEYRDITDYVGSTKVATVASVYTVEPSANDAYDIKIAFINPMTIFEFKEALKGQVQDKHNRRELSFADTDEALEIGTVNYVDTLGGAPTFTVPVQYVEYLGAWFEIIDDESNFAASGVTVDFDDADAFEGEFDTDYVCNEKNVKYRFKYVDDDFGWTVEKYNTLGFISATDKQVPYGNSSNVLESEAGFEYDTSIDTLSVENLIVASDVTVNHTLTVASDVTVSGTIHAGSFKHTGDITFVPTNDLIVGDGTSSRSVILDGGASNRVDLLLRKAGSDEWSIRQNGSDQDLQFYSSDSGGGIVLELFDEGIVSVGTGTINNLDATGDLYVQDELEVDGDSYFAGELTYYGEMYQASNVTVTTINTVDVFEEVSNFSTGNTRDVTYASDSLTVTHSGKYLVNVSVCAFAVGANKNFSFAVSVNDVVQLNVFGCRKLATANDAGSITLSGILNLSANDVIKLEVANTTDATNITIRDTNVCLIKL